MRFRFFLPGLVFVLGTGDFGAASGNTTDLKNLLSGREFEHYQNKDEHETRLRVLRHALERQVLILRNYSRKGNDDAVTENLRNMRTLIRHIKQVARGIPRGSESDELKNLEIDTRKLIETLDEIKLRHSVQLQSQFRETTSGLEDLRPLLFRGLFRLKSNGLSGPLAQAAMTMHDSAGVPFSFDEEWEEATERDVDCRGIYFQSKRAVLERVIVSSTQDFFTPDEYAQLQGSESLSYRTRLFLRMAEKRVEAVDSKADNCDTAVDICLDSPLSELLQGYQSAIHEAMMKIDEAVRFRGKVDGDVGRSLRRLKAAVSRFIPRLERLARHVTSHPESASLLGRIEEAQRISIRARDWSQCEGKALVQ